ncbi:MAG: hypothetical protein ACO1QR_16505 [Chthoniobacteraceae bacterium]
MTTSSLFRYHRLQIMEGEENATARKEIERFTAAAIALCFRHDESFRQHFWARICRLDGNPAIPDSATIEVEPCPWADLLIRSRGPLHNIVH